MSRCRQWRIHLGVLSCNGTGGSELTEAEEMACLQESRWRYQQLAEKHPFPVEDDDEEEPQSNNGEGVEDASSASVQPGAPHLDPLTAMMMEEQSKQERLQEMDLQYRKERARRRNRGIATQRVVESEEYDETAVTLQIIDKDLQRLPPLNTSNSNSDNTDQRVSLLRHVLFVYHCATHPTPGYRQGMHEIASYLLCALEQEGGSDHNMAADTYALLCAVLGPLQPAFDVSTEEEKQPLVALGRRILQVTGAYHPYLLQCLQQKVQVPPQLYLTKWIRLLFSRELLPAHAAVQTVLPFWDFVFASSARAGGSSGLLAVLEAAAAARLLLAAPQILSTEDPLHFLMNLPPIETSTAMGPWQTVTTEILQRKTTPLSHVILTVPPRPPPLPAPSSPSLPLSPTQQQPQKSAADASSSSSTLWNHPLSALTSSTSDPLSSSMDPHNSSSRPLTLSSLSAGLKQTLEQAKTKTQSLSKRIYEEWEHAQHQQQQQQHSSDPLSQHQSRQQAHQLQTYNVGYRDDPLTQQQTPPPPPEPTVYDSPTMVVMPPVSSNTAATNGHSNINNKSEEEWQQAFAMHTTVVQSFLTHLEQEQGVSVPSAVWQAVADLHELRNQKAKR